MFKIVNSVCHDLLALPMVISVRIHRPRALDLKQKQ